MVNQGASHVLALFSHTGATMVLDLQTAFNIIVGICIAGAGWWAKEIWNALAKLREDIHDIEVDLPSNYIKKEDFNDAMKTLNEKLDRIWFKLEDKADKH
jgi:hypothetical protein